MRRSLFLLAALAASAHAQRGNPFAPPNAKIQVAPVSGYDLKHVAVTLDVDYPNRSFKGQVVNRLAPLSDGMTQIKLHAGEAVIVESVTVDGKAATHTQTGQELLIPTVALAKGKDVEVLVKYHVPKAKDAVSFGGGGWHWVESNGLDPKQIGFWTQGETEYNREWAPTWDYPNDFATSETRITVAKGWTVVGNGSLIGQKDEGAKSIWHWKQNQPHATYLISLAAGPFDVKKEKWKGKDLWYVVPGGKGHLIEPSFGDTADMLNFFESVTGIPYPWDKYAQNALIDFGGGMENISSTHLGADELTDGKNGFRTMSSLNAHELAHQWFGDIVTCKDWGHIWLNESLATYMQWAYFEHSQGRNGYMREVNSGVGEYLGESRRYRRPLATNMYPDADSMFDSHSYPKGAAVLHTLRRQIGDQKFYAGLKRYLVEHRHQPVESADLMRAMSKEAGVDLRPFWDQWIYKPGHPVFAYDWNWSDNKLTLDVRQIQDTSNGTPIYRVDVPFVAITGGRLTYGKIALDAKENRTSMAMPKPDAVILDPNFDILREMDHRFGASELAAIAEFAPSPLDRASALAGILRQDQPDINLVARLLDSDMAAFPVYASKGVLARFAKDLGFQFWKRQASHPDYNRRSEAVRGLMAFKEDALAKEFLRSLVSEEQPTMVVVFALGAFEAATDTALFLRAAQMPSLRSEIRNSALLALAKANVPETWPLVWEAGASTDEDRVSGAVQCLAYADTSAKTREIYNRAFASSAPQLKRYAIQSLAAKPDPQMKEAIQKVSEDPSVPRDIRDNARKLLTN